LRRTVQELEEVLCLTALRADFPAANSAKQPMIEALQEIAPWNGRHTAPFGPVWYFHIVGGAAVSRLSKRA
jgi:hypothetical protein